MGVGAGVGVGVGVGRRPDTQAMIESESRANIQRDFFLVLTARRHTEATATPTVA